MKTITVTLDEYEVSNLRELLRCCGYPHDPEAEPPFAYNTGDWLGQLWWKLDPMKTEHKPNVTIEQVRGYLSAAQPATPETELPDPWEALAHWCAGRPQRRIDAQELYGKRAVVAQDGLGNERASDWFDTATQAAADLCEKLSLVAPVATPEPREAPTPLARTGTVYVEGPDGSVRGVAVVGLREAPAPVRVEGDIPRMGRGTASGSPLRNGREVPADPREAPAYPSYCRITGHVFPCGCASCDVLSAREAPAPLPISANIGRKR